jgi:hypothetical protein
MLGISSQFKELFFLAVGREFGVAVKVPDTH